MHRLAQRPPRDFVPAGYFVASLCAYGLGKSALAEHLRLQEQQLEREDLLLSTRDHHSMLEWASKQLELPDLGVRLGLSVTSEDFGLFGYIIKTAATLAESLEDVVRYHRLFARDSRMFLRATQTHLHLEYLPNTVTGVETVQDILFSLSAAVAHIRRVLGDHWQPVGAQLAFSKDQLAADLRPHFGNAVQFDHHVSAISLLKSDAMAPMPEADPVLHGILKAQADPVIDSIAEESELIHSVRLLIAGNLHDPAFGMAQAASAVNMSVRGLHRALERHNSSYSSLREQAVWMLAREALSNSDAPITRIAHRLGYSETSAFTRAFVRLTGQTPTKFRQASRNGETQHRGS